VGHCCGFAISTKGIDVFKGKSYLHCSCCETTVMGNILLQAIAFVFLPIFITDNTSQRQVESLYRAVNKLKGIYALC